MPMPQSTRKGYLLTAGQIARYDALLPYVTPGASYVRGVADNVGRAGWAEDAFGVDYFLTHAEAALPGGREIADVIRTVG